jgi:assimilatory nitrate reductase catalytic subunit
MSRTGTLGRLFGHVPEPDVQLHAQDMERRGFKPDDLLHVTSRRGSIVLPVHASAQVGLGQAFIAMHWGSEFVAGGVNRLTISASCPTSKQPELKHAAVKLLKAELPWTLLAAAWFAEGDGLRTREELKTLLSAFPYACCVPFGHHRAGVLFRAAAYEAPPPELVARIESAMKLQVADALRYDDKRRGQRRTVRLVRRGDEARIEGFLLAGDTRAESWMKALLQDELPAQAYGRLLLAPGAKPPAAISGRGRAICTCFDVTQSQIGSCLAQTEGSEGERLATLQSQLRCGTNCGSCIPELKRLVRETQPQLSI